MCVTGWLVACPSVCACVRVHALPLMRMCVSFMRAPSVLTHCYPHLCTRVSGGAIFIAFVITVKLNYDKSKKPQFSHAVATAIPMEEGSVEVAGVTNTKEKSDL